MQSFVVRVCNLVGLCATALSRPLVRLLQGPSGGSVTLSSIDRMAPGLLTSADDRLLVEWSEFVPGTVLPKNRVADDFTLFL